jgi:hypothetical protein
MAVYEVKKLVSEREGIPPTQYRFITARKVLEDSLTLSEHMIDHGATLYMLVGLQGGKLSKAYPHSMN